MNARMEVCFYMLVHFSLFNPDHNSSIRFHTFIFSHLEYYSYLHFIFYCLLVAVYLF